MKSGHCAFKSQKQDWETPKEFYKMLNAEFHFDFDPCPSNYIKGKVKNGLKVKWGKSNFVNPPYTSQLQDAFIKKGLEEYKKGKTVVFLIPARTDTKRFHDIILPNAKEIRFIKGRLKFSGYKDPAPFPSMIVIFKNSHNKK